MREAEASLEGSQERIRLVRAGLIARASSRLTEGEVVVLQSATRDLLPPHPGEQHGTPTRAMSADLTLAYHRAHPKIGLPSGVRRFGIDPVADDLEAFVRVRSMGPISTTNAPTRYWRQAAAGVLTQPTMYEDYLTRTGLRPAPRPLQAIPFDGHIENSETDVICEHLRLNGVTIQEARRWRVWAQRALLRIEQPSADTPPLTYPLMPWDGPGLNDPALENGAPVVPTNDGVGQDVDMTPAVPPTQNPDGANGPDEPNAPGLPTEDGEVPDQNPPIAPPRSPTPEVDYS